MNKEKILIVDDDADLLTGLRVRLQASRFDVVVASDAIAAISVARKEEPALIILDIGLPGGDGFLVIERLRGVVAVAHTPIIVLSAREPAENQARALRAGARAYFQKPVDNAELMAAIQQALQEPGLVDTKDEVATV